MSEIGKIISQLEQQRDAMDRAIAALREVEDQGPKPVKRQMSAAGRRRIIEATKKRWAAKRAADAAEAKTSKASPKAPTAKVSATKRKPNLSPEGRQRLADAMKQRWAVKRSATQAKKPGRKKAA